MGRRPREWNEIDYPPPPQKPKRKKPRPFTARQRLFMNEITKGKTQVSAAKIAGYSPKFKNPMSKTMISIMEKAMEKEGINDAYLAKKIKAGLEAGQFLRTAEGDFIEKPDFNARHKHIDTALKLRNDYPDEKPVAVDTNITIKWED